MAIDVLFFDDVTSTSASAADELRRGRQAPFAICAARQSGGRGRRGRAWSSPEGGLYLTVVLPPPAIEISHFGLIPLWVGVTATEWLSERFGFQAALKWPNDLMFDGRKLGGILVESGVEGTKSGPVLIGIGLNINVRPTITPTEKDHTLAVSVGEIVGADLDTRTLASELAHELGARWQAAAVLGAVDGFIERCAPTTRMWQSAGDYFYAHSVDASGALVLKAFADQANIHSLNSADHKFIACTRTNPLPVALADVGNSTTKIKLFRSAWSDEVIAEARVAHDQNNLAAELSRLSAYLPCKGWPLFIASVAPVRASTLFAHAEAVGFAPVPLTKKSILRRGSSYPLQDLGIDRLAAIEGWLSQRPTGSAVIVSCGTAVTVDVVQGGRVHSGGVIAPGLSLSARALHEHTGLLPLIPQEDLSRHDVLGSSTRTAIAAGLKGQALGLIERICRMTERDTGGRPHVVLCGGDAALLAPELPGAVTDEGLIFKGLRAMAAGGLFNG